MGNREPGNEPETVIAAGVKVEGDFVSQGDVLIEGIVEGSLKTERDLRVGERASISADVSASNATIAGEIKGNIVISERLELQPTARLYGDVRTKVLVVANGAQVNGNIAMGEAGESAKASKGKSDVVEKIKAKVAEKEEVVEEKEKEKSAMGAFFGPKS